MAKYSIGIYIRLSLADIDLSRKEEFEYAAGPDGSGTSGASGVAGKKKNNSKKYICPMPDCKCSVRATKEVQIACMLHDSPVMMVIEEK